MIKDLWKRLVSPSRRRIVRGPLARRDFLKLFGAATAGAAASLRFGSSGRAAAQQAQQAPVTKVLIEHLPLNAQALAAGALDGVAATPSGITLVPGRGRGQYVSPALSARNRFTHVGLRWAALGTEALSFEVRWSVDGTVWSEWDTVMVDDHVSEATSETFSPPIRTSLATRIQFRTTFENGRSQPVLRAVTVTLLNVVDGPTVSALPSPPAAPPNLGVDVTIYHRGSVSQGGWGANESLRFINGDEFWDRMYVPVKRAVVHHTATTNSYTNVTQAMEEVRAIYTLHAVNNGWTDIGYNALIDKFGNVYEGRYGRDDGATREVISPGIVAGHALHHNYGSTGIALLGTFTKRGEASRPGITPSDRMKATLRKLLGFEASRHDIGPKGLGDFLRTDYVWNNGLKDVSGHRDTFPTICPGGNVYDLLPTLRDQLAADLKRDTPTVSIVPPQQNGTAIREYPAAGVGSLQFRWNSSQTGRFKYLFEGWRRAAPDPADLNAEYNVIYKAGFDTYGTPAGSEPYPDWKDTSLTTSNFADLFAAFKRAGTTPAVGDRYTLHVVAVDSTGRLSVRAEHTIRLT